MRKLEKNPNTTRCAGRPRVQFHAQQNCSETRKFTVLHG